ncbi:MAG: hypothetical protein JW827_00590 [Spirochaetes bacterium]|nr:hypothetical protein [Spirochaetota bacterium]
MKLILIFIDGIGIGQKNKTNPFLLQKSLYLSHFKSEFKTKWKRSEGFIVYSLDPMLGVSGIPQSASGQSSIFTGINVARLLQGHLTGFPNKRLRALLMKKNLFLELEAMGRKVKFINAYPLFAEKLNKQHLLIDENGNFIIKENQEGFAKILKRISVTTVLAMSIKQKFFGLEDLKEKKSIFHDLTNQYLIRQGLDVPPFTPKIAAHIMVDNLKRFDVLLYEYFLTDKIGHLFLEKESLLIVKILDEFITELVNLTNGRDVHILIFSDHGNFEDQSVKTHTKNNIPFVHIGKNTEVNDEIQNITDIYPYILNLAKMN